MDVIAHPFHQILFFSSLNAFKSSPTISEIFQCLIISYKHFNGYFDLCIFHHVPMPCLMPIWIPLFVDSSNISQNALHTFTSPFSLFWQILNNFQFFVTTYAKYNASRLNSQSRSSFKICFLQIKKFLCCLFTCIILVICVQLNLLAAFHLDSPTNKTTVKIIGSHVCIGTCFLKH